MARFTTAELLRHAHVSWLDIFTRDDKMFVLLDTIVESVNRDTASYEIAPRDPFRFMRHDLQDVRAVVVAQYPYYDHKDIADGFAISCGNAKTPTRELAAVFRAMHSAGVTPSAEQKTTGLEYLAVQGVLLLNTALTTRVGHPGSHAQLWRPWTNMLIRELARSHSRPLVWCLWGVDVHRVESIIASVEPSQPRHTIFKAGRPSLWQSNFVDETAPQIAHIARMCPELVWNGDMADTDLFTDGAAPGNGRATCRAAYGVVCTRGLLAGREWNGELETREIRLADKVVPARPSNIRAEGLALIVALQQAIRVARAARRVRIHSDSHFWICDMLDSYIPTWIERGIPFTAKKNSDLVEKFWRLACKGRRMGVEFVFVRAWHDRAEPAHGTEDHYHWTGNRAAERVAQSALD